MGVRSASPPPQLRTLSAAKARLAGHVVIGRVRGHPPDSAPGLEPLGISGATVPPGGHAAYPEAPRLHHLRRRRHLELRPGLLPGTHCPPCYWLLMIPPPQAWTGRLSQHLPPSERTGRSPYRMILDWLLLQRQHLALGGGFKDCGSGDSWGWGATPSPSLSWSLLAERPSESGVGSRGRTPSTSCWI